MPIPHFHKAWKPTYWDPLFQLAWIICCGDSWANPRKVHFSSRTLQNVEKLKNLQKTCLSQKWGLPQSDPNRSRGGTNAPKVCGQSWLELPTVWSGIARSILRGDYRGLEPSGLQGQELTWAHNTRWTSVMKPVGPCSPFQTSVQFLITYWSLQSRI